MATEKEAKITIWVLTPNGVHLARRLQAQWPDAAVFYAQRLGLVSGGTRWTAFNGLVAAVAHQFNLFDQHIFIMATGIVVRAIAPLLKHKTVDPAVVVVDDRGQFAVSLVSGHLGGANRMARRVGDVLGATPVITTATDVNRKPAIDLIARQQELKIENPECIKHVNMALLNNDMIRVYDPQNWLAESLAGQRTVPDDPGKNLSGPAGVWVTDIFMDSPPATLVLRPPSLVAGIGCNRNTPLTEIRDHLLTQMQQYGLALDSLHAIASIDLKSDEPGLCQLAEDMNLHLEFFSKQTLSQVAGVPTPSVVVAKHVGVPSVCEAAALLASNNGQLIVPKQRTANVTVAIARRASMWSASDPDT